MLARIKVGDLVEVRSGKNKGVRGKILEFSKDKTKVKVEGVALVNARPKKTVANDSQKNEGPLKKESFIHACKVMPICPQTSKPCRVRASVTAEGEKVRVSAKSGLKI